MNLKYISLIVIFFMFSFFTEGKSNPKYVFYLHGRIVELQGLDAYSPKYGKYEYEKIIESLKDTDVTVFSEVRSENTDIFIYAKKIAGQVDSLLKIGIKSEDITVIGASKGALIAMEVSTLLKNKNINFVFIAGSFKSVEKNFKFNLYGNILGFYEKSDLIAGSSYLPLINVSEGINSFKEIMLNTNMGHGIVFKPLKEWLIPTKKFINKSKK